MRHVTIESLLDYPVEIRREMWRTAGKDGNAVLPLSAKQLATAFVSEHSPIRMTLFRVVCRDMLYYTHVHFVRHTFLQPFVVSHRPDQTGQERSVDDTVEMALVGNAQAWLDLMQVRLCTHPSPDTHAWAIAIKRAFAETHPEFAACLVPQCVYRFDCPEGSRRCGWFDRQNPPRWIRERYDWYAQVIASAHETD